MKDDPEPEADSGQSLNEQLEARRKMLLQMFGAAGMASFALVSLGASAHPRPSPTPACGTYDSGGNLIYDTDCGVSGPDGVYQDADCEMPLKTGDTKLSGDNDCGLQGPGGSTHTDQDCGTLQTEQGGMPIYHHDNDCRVTQNDLDCGLPKDTQGGTWQDNS